MASPIYKGVAQSNATGGWLTGLGSWFTGTPPAYAGKGRAPASSGYFGGAQPAYKPAPVRTDGAVYAPDAEMAEASSECPADAERITVLIPRELIEPQQ